MTEVEVYVGKNEWFLAILIGVLIVIAKEVRACETKTVYLPDGTMQVCQVCNDVVICY